MGGAQDELAALLIGRVISELEVENLQHACEHVRGQLEAAREASRIERRAAAAREAEAAAQLAAVREEAAKEAAAWREALEQSEAERLEAKQQANDSAARVEALTLKLSGAKQAAMRLAAGLEAS
mmetsp:Transcript_72854/g.144802  ORF Transcript_72854/g.144802 Transcript_72854/m.144802 type:complete len:125 (+) Transcript_72854:275-649(+)